MENYSACHVSKNLWGRQGRFLRGRPARREYISPFSRQKRATLVVDLLIWSGKEPAEVVAAFPHAFRNQLGMEVLVKKWQRPSVMLQLGLFLDTSKLRPCWQLSQLAEMPCMSLLKRKRHMLENDRKGGVPILARVPAEAQEAPAFPPSKTGTKCLWAYKLNSVLPGGWEGRKVSLGLRSFSVTKCSLQWFTCNFTLFYVN